MATQPAWMADAVPVSGKQPDWMKGAIPVGEEPAAPAEPQETTGVLGKIGDMLVDNPFDIVGQALRRNAREGTFASDAAKDDGFLDRAGSLIERGDASIGAGLLQFLGGLGSKRARDEAAVVQSGTTNQPIAGTTQWQDVNSIGGLGKFLVDTGIESAPSMATLAVPWIGPATIGTSQTGNIAANRAANDGRDAVTGDDLATAAPWAIGSTALDVFGLKGITAPLRGAVDKAERSLLGRIAVAGAGEGSTEAAQSGLEYAGGSVGTEAGFDLPTMLDQSLQGGVAGFGTGAAVRGGAEIASPVTSRLGKRAGGQAAPGQQQTTDDGYEGSLDDLMRNQQPILALPKPDWMKDAKPVDAPAPQRALPAPRPQADPVTDFMQRARGAESGGNDGAANPRSSAKGRYQFIDSTWLQTYKSEFGNTGETDAQILAKRKFGKMQDRLMRRLTEDNADGLRKAGVPVTTGNLYLAHFAGVGGAIKLHNDPNASAESVLGKSVVSANPFLAGKTAAQVIAWAGGKMGDASTAAGTATASTDGDLPAIDIPGADGSLLGRSDGQQRIANIEIPEASPQQREMGKATPVEFDVDSPAFAQGKAEAEQGQRAPRFDPSRSDADTAAYLAGFRAASSPTPAATQTAPLPELTPVTPAIAAIPNAPEAPALPGFETAPEPAPTGDLTQQLRGLVGNRNVSTMAPEQVRPLTARRELMARAYGLDPTAVDLDEDTTSRFDHKVARLALGDDRYLAILDGIDAVISNGDQAEILAQIPDDALRAVEAADRLVTTAYSVKMTELNAEAGSVDAKKALPAMRKRLEAERKAAKALGVAVPGVEALATNGLKSTVPASQSDLLARPEPVTPSNDVETDRPGRQASPAARSVDNEPDGGSRRAVPTLARGQLRALGIAQELRTEKAAALVGRTASTPRELAEIAQVYRDPRYETFRIFLTKGDTIVHATGVSAREVTEAPLMPKGMDQAGFFASIADAMKASGADGYYLLHNHPSGDPEPSFADKRATGQIAAKVPGFRAHVVINSSKYAQITVAGGRTSSRVSALDATEDKLIAASVPHELLGKMIGHGSQLAVIGKTVQKPGWISVIGTDARLAVRVVVDYPAATAKRDAKALMAMARRIQRQSGSASLFLVGDRATLDTPIVARAIKASIVTAAVDAEGKPINVSSGRGKGLPKRAGMRVAQPAYHGSPHWFDKFKLDAIGTGEGAQAYGWGLYFAGKKEVAQYYRDKLSSQWRSGDDMAWGGKTALQWYEDAERKSQYGKLMVLERIMLHNSKTEIVTALEEGIADGDTQAVDGMAYLKTLPDDAFAPTAGHLYEVDIPEDDEYLLWDKPLSEQPAKVKAALETVFASRNPATVQSLRNLDGGRIYKSLNGTPGVKGQPAYMNEQAVSEALHNAGIGGIKYKDGLSRPSDGGSYNYVIFDEDRISILKVEDKAEPYKGSNDPGEKIASKLVDKDGLSRDMAAIKSVVGNPLKTLGALMKSGLADNARAAFYTMDSRLRSLARRYDSAAINALADQFHARAGVVDKAVDETYHEATEREGFGRAGQVWRILEPYAGNKGAMDRIGLMLRDPTKRQTGARRAEAEAASKLAKLLKDTIDYRKAAGEEIGEVSDGYFPRMIDVEKAVRERGLFLRQATELYKRHGAENPQASAEAWLARLFDQYAGLDGGPDFIDLFHDTRKAGVGRSTSKGREFGKDADKLLAQFYDNDTGQVLTAYMLGAARKAEEARRFGDGKLEKMMRQIKADIRKSGDDAGDTIDTISRMVASNLGRTAPVGERARAATSILHTAGQLGTLDRATITSLSEAMMGFVRAGPRYGTQMVIDSAREFARNLIHAPPSEAARMAEALGIANDAMIGEALAARAGFERANTTRRAQKVQQGYFKATGLHQWTEGTRAAATRMGGKFLSDLAYEVQARGRKGERAGEYLRELGIKDPAAFGAWLRAVGSPTPDSLTRADADTMERQYRSALVRFANQTIMKPTRAEKPRWSNHPVGSLFFALMSYSYGFKKNVLDRTGRMGMRAVKAKDPSLLYPAFGLAGLFAVHTAIQAARQALLGGGREDDKEGIEFLDVVTAMDRAGLFGAASPLLNAVFGLKYRRGVIESLAGPVVGRPADLVTKTLSLATDANSPNTNSAERAAAGALYDVVIEPAIEAYGVTRFKGALAGAAVWGTGNREGGVLPPDRDMFIEAVAGTKKE